MMNANKSERFALDILTPKLGVYGLAHYFAPAAKAGRGYTRDRPLRLDGLADDILRENKAGRLNFRASTHLI